MNRTPEFAVIVVAGHRESSRPITMSLMQLVLDWLAAHPWEIGAVLGVLLVLLMLQRAFRGIRRRRKPAPLHPRLQPYAGRTDAEAESERVAAGQIIATSSTPNVVGYELIQQIEAVFVEGQRSPNDAVTALKALAARKGANAIINLSQSRTAAGRCTAQGDAVIVRPNAAAT